MPVSCLYFCSTDDVICCVLSGGGILEHTASVSVGPLRGILNDLGVTIQPSTAILDFGCGAGATVNAFRDAGYDARGCDIVPPQTPNPYLHLMRNGRIPFPDASFDVIVSESVMEHVMDYALTVREISRVLRSGGTALHLFPSRYC